MKRRNLIALLGGTAFAWPLSASAEQKSMPVIGFLFGGFREEDAPLMAACREGLSETGYVEGQNVAIEFRWAEGRYDRMPALVAELVGRNVDLIAAGNLPAALAAKNATAAIPIIFAIGVDPVERGLVTSFNRPGGNLTGISSLNIELTQKRVELLTELVPQARVIALLVNPNNPTAERVVRDVLEAANAKGVQLHA